MKEKNKQLQLLKTALEEKFPISKTDHHFLVFPLCNEDGFYRLSRFLRTIQCKDKLKQEELSVAFLIGESNFLSLLPQMKFIDSVILADVEPRLHFHNQHLLRCIQATNSPAEFTALYLQDNPLENIVNQIDDNRIYPINIQGIQTCWNKKSSLNFTSLKKYHFLHDQKSFDACKKAISELSIVHVQLDMRCKEKCLHLAEIIASHQGKISLCNFTNLHHYIESEILKETVGALLSLSKDCLIMYAKSGISSLTTYISEEIKDYFLWICQGKNIRWRDNNLLSPLALRPSNPRFFSFTKEAITPQSPRSYVGMLYVTPKIMRSLQRGTLNINQLDRITTPAQISFEQAMQIIRDTRQLLLEKNPELSNSKVELPPSWIIELQGEPNSINALLAQVIDISKEEKKVKNPLAQEEQGWKFLSRMIKVHQCDPLPAESLSPVM